MFKLISLLIISLNLFGDIISVEDNIKELKSMNHVQRSNLVMSFQVGKKEGFGETLSAICWQESKAGQYLVNLSDPSFGLYHNLISTVLSRLGVKNNEYYRNKYANLLIEDRNFASSMAIEELKFWHGYHKSKKGNKSIWELTIRSYNAGHNHLITEADEYYINIQNKIKALRQTKYL